MVCCNAHFLKTVYLISKSLLIIRLECEAQIKGFAGAKFKKFSTKEEADSFVQNGGVASDCVLAQYSQPSASKIVPAAKKFTASSNSQQGNYYAVAKGKNVGIYSTW